MLSPSFSLQKCVNPPKHSNKNTYVFRFNADIEEEKCCEENPKKKKARVVNLKPFINYQFRLVAELTGSKSPYTLALSKTSLTVATMAQGAPGSPPTILAVRSNRFLQDKFS